MNKVVVVGEGIVGASTAYHLARTGIDVTTVDASRDGQATAAGAGIVSPSGTTSQLPEFNQLMAESFSHYEWLIPQLTEEGESDTGFETVGELLVALDDVEDKLLDDARHIAEQRHADGVRGIGEVELVDMQTAKRMFPALSDIPRALHIPGAARLDGRKLRLALLGAAEKHGLTRISGEAELLAENGDVSGVTVGGRSIESDAVVVAGGAWSNNLLGAIGFEVPVEPQRGQIAHISVPETETSAWPILATFQRHYILTFPRNRVVAGATREDGSGFDYRMTAGGVAEVLESGFSIASGLRSATLEEVRIGFRPKSVDGLPILGKVPGQERLYLATGHGPAGLSLGAHSGAMVADLILGNEISFDLEPYSPTRFSQW
jgi:D-amino-acid dehydrogenase